MAKIVYFFITVFGTLWGGTVMVNTNKFMSDHIEKLFRKMHV